MTDEDLGIGCEVWIKDWEGIVAPRVCVSKLLEGKGGCAKLVCWGVNDLMSYCLLESFIFF
jgi:hypothetical protein